jgi:transcriptional regulator with XRE-family HTH domain
VQKPRLASSEFGALLRHHRLAAGISQEVLAEQARMSANGISALERGQRRSPYRETVALLIKALSLPPAVAAEFEAAAARPQRPCASTDRGDEGALATNLPSQRTSLVGRETEIAHIIDILQDGRLYHGDRSRWDRQDEDRASCR